MTLPVTHGVVQGSILGPILFLLFTNDLPQHVPHGKLILYADDAQFLDSDLSQNLPQLKHRVESTLSVALRWFTQNRLKINPTKTDMIILKSSRTSTDLNITARFGNTNITSVQSAKILGVTIDSCLSWERHISVVVRRCNCVLIGLARMQSRIPRETKRLLVEALVFPHLRYCMSVWGSCTAAQKNRLQKCINFGARVVTGLGYRDHVTGALTELGWRKIGEMIEEHDRCTMYRLIHGEGGPEVMRSHIKRRSDVSARATRATDDEHLEMPLNRSEFARRSFLARAVRAWNALPCHVRRSPTYAVFRRRLSGQ